MADDGFDMDAEWTRVVQQVFAGKLKSGVIDVVTAVATAKRYMQAVFEGTGTNFDKVDYTSPDHELLRNLERNVYQFAGAKNYQTIRALNDLLRDGDRLRTRAEFKREAVKSLTQWNGVWLDTEYQTAVNSAVNARKWQEFNERADIMPLLQFKVVKDERLCPICMPFADMVRPINDPVWDYATPSLHFGDRCTILQLPDTTTPITTDVPGEDGIPKMFRVNFAKQQLAFPDDHPYYNGVPQRVLDDMLANRRYDHQFSTTYQNGNGLVRQHAQTDINARDYARVHQIAVDKADAGHKVDIMPELVQTHPARKVIYHDGKPRKNPDLRIDGVLVEVEHTRKNRTQSISDAIKKGAAQANSVIISIEVPVSEGVLKDVARGRFKTHSKLQTIEYEHDGVYTKFKREDF